MASKQNMASKQKTKSGGAAAKGAVKSAVKSVPKVAARSGTAKSAAAKPAAKGDGKSKAGGAQASGSKVPSAKAPSAKAPAKAPAAKTAAAKPALAKASNANAAAKGSAKPAHATSSAKKAPAKAAPPAAKSGGSDKAGVKHPAGDKNGRATGAATKTQATDGKAAQSTASAKAVAGKSGTAKSTATGAAKADAKSGAAVSTKAGQAKHAAAPSAHGAGELARAESKNGSKPAKTDAGAAKTPAASAEPVAKKGGRNVPPLNPRAKLLREKAARRAAAHSAALAAIREKSGRSGKRKRVVLEPEAPPTNEGVVWGGISDVAVKRATGRGWNEWLKLLDAAGAMHLTHAQIAQLVHTRFGGGDWWSQMVTVGYEQARSLRKKHETAEGFSVSASRVMDVPIERTWRAFEDPKMLAQWLPGVRWTVTTSTARKSLRLLWDDQKTRVEVQFSTKGPARSQVSVQHRKIEDEKAAQERKFFWGERLDSLKILLEGT